MPPKGPKAATQPAAVTKLGKPAAGAKTVMQAQATTTATQPNKRATSSKPVVDVTVTVTPSKNQVGRKLGFTPEEPAAAGQPTRQQQGGGQSVGHTDPLASLLAEVAALKAANAALTATGKNVTFSAGAQLLLDSCFSPMKAGAPRGACGDASLASPGGKKMFLVKEVDHGSRQRSEEEVGDVHQEEVTRPTNGAAPAAAAAAAPAAAAAAPAAAAAAAAAPAAAPPRVAIPRGTLGGTGGPGSVAMPLPSGFGPGFEIDVIVIDIVVYSNNLLLLGLTVHASIEYITDAQGKTVSRAVAVPRTAFTAHVARLTFAELQSRVGPATTIKDWVCKVNRESLAYDGNPTYLDGLSLNRAPDLGPFLEYNAVLENLAAYFKGTNGYQPIRTAYTIPHRVRGQFALQFTPTTVERSSKDGKSKCYSGLRPVCPDACAALDNMAASATGPVSCVIEYWFNPGTRYEKKSAFKPARFLFTDAFVVAEQPRMNRLVISIKTWPGFGEMEAIYV